MGVPVSVATYVVGGSHISGVVYLFPQQVTLRENFHARGAILGDESPAGASFYCYHGASLKNVIHEPLAVAECGNDEGERVFVGGVGEPRVIRRPLCHPPPTNTPPNYCRVVSTMPFLIFSFTFLLFAFIF